MNRHGSDTAQLPERVAFADVQNISHNRSLGSQKSRESYVDSPVGRPKRLLTRDMFDSSDDIPAVTTRTSKEQSSERSQSHAKHAIRRTRSAFSVEDGMQFNLSRMNASSNISQYTMSDMQIDMEIDIDESVFDDEMSPNISAIPVHHFENSRVSASCFAVNRIGSPDLFIDYKLEAVENPQVSSRAFRSISPGVLADAVEAEDFFDKFVLIDCRYPYEYRGGHIRGSLNVNDPKELDNIFFPKSISDPVWMKIPIFYCEYSQKRGPTMAHHLRSVDRRRNELEYPRLDYREMYLLDRGYNGFWNTGLYKSLCEPSSYVSMFDEQHSKELALFNSHKRKGWRKSRRMTRHQSLLDLDDEQMDTHDGFSAPYRTSSMANISQTCDRSVKRRLDFD